ncbi:MAG TPA: CoA ester lyase [Thermomicrobiales bacterium]|jgi:citrate lyase beta subunit|nr:CoA ester lyase [Thermomicrobiales bacterium]
MEAHSGRRVSYSPIRTRTSCPDHSRRVRSIDANQPHPQGIRRTRSVLSVPAIRSDLIPKGLASAADMILIDLEASVAAADKDRARSNAVDALARLDFGRMPRAVRINAVASGLAYRDLIALFEGMDNPIDFVVVPQVRDAGDIHHVDRLLEQLELTTGRTTRTGLEVIIEEATALRDVGALARASDRLEALVYGPGDLAAALGMPMRSLGVPDEWDDSYPGHRIHHILAELLVAARAAGLRVIDGPFARIGDDEGLRRAALVSRGMGYDGKWCIHPSQIATVNAAFSPSDDEIAHARRIVAALDEAAGEGLGAVTVDGHMIDLANVRLARRTLAMVEDLPT